MSRRNRNTGDPSLRTDTNDHTKPKKPRDPSLRYFICVPVRDSDGDHAPSRPLATYKTKTQAQKMMTTVASIGNIAVTELTIYKCVKVDTKYVKRERKAKVEV